MTESPVWAIAAYFDPLGSGRRLDAYREFRRRLNIPLVAVELSLNGRFELCAGDADVLIQLRGGAVLWQKERLLNIALRRLPEHCDTVAWLDCDIVFMREDWAAEARCLLKEPGIVQPFERVYYLNPGDAVRVPNGGRERDYFDSYARLFVDGRVPEESYHSIAASQRFRFTPGMAWVAPRRVLERHGFYDAAVIGGGDSLIRDAGNGRYEERADALGMGPSRRRHYVDWAQRFHSEIRGRLAYLPGEILHLWHGDLEDRRYGARYQGFDRFDFDPARDVAQTPEGAWRWNSCKPELHAFVQTHFELLDRAWARSKSAVCE